jgi:hypothetical protein
MSTANDRSAAMADGRRADSQRRRERVAKALQTAAASGAEISISAIARTAPFTEQAQEFLQLSR